jgi:hypothetical protein
MWAYKVDMTRVNEYGQGGEDTPPEKKPKGSKAITGETKESKKVK